MVIEDIERKITTINNKYNGNFTFKLNRRPLEVG